jgi:hypothetical protein
MQISNLSVAYGPDGTTYVVWAGLDPSNSDDDGIYASVRLPEKSFPTIPDTVDSGQYLHPADPQIAVDVTGYATIVASIFDPNEGQRIASFGYSPPILPRLVTNPVISPKPPSAGKTLTCSTGLWANQPTKYTYRWLRSNSPVGGATAASFPTKTTDAGQHYQCEVTATNAEGSAIAKSATVTITPPEPWIIIGSTSVKVSGTKAPVKLVCKVESCAGTAELLGTVVQKGKNVTVVLATSSYSLAAGKSATVSLLVTASGKTILAKVAKSPLVEIVQATVHGGSTATQSVRVT